MKKSLFVLVMTLVSTSTACIEDGPLPPEETTDAAPTTEVDALVSDNDAYSPPVDAAILAPDAVLPPVDAAAPTPDAMVPVPDAAPIPEDASTPDAYDTTPPGDAAILAPDAALPPPVDAAVSSDASAPDACTPSPVCHGLLVNFSAADVAEMHHCTGWSASGSATLLPPQTEIIGADGICAITCNRGESGETVLPSQCSGVWLSGGTADVPRWYTAGCKRLPDHPPAEPNQAGCTWDKRCDLY